MGEWVDGLMGRIRMRLIRFPYVPTIFINPMAMFDLCIVADTGFQYRTLLRQDMIWAEMSCPNALIGHPSGSPEVDSRLIHAGMTSKPKSVRY